MNKAQKKLFVIAVLGAIINLASLIIWLTKEDNIIPVIFFGIAALSCIATAVMEYAACGKRKK